MSERKDPVGRGVGVGHADMSGQFPVTLIVPNTTERRVTESRERDLHTVVRQCSLGE